VYPDAPYYNDSPYDQIYFTVAEDIYNSGEIDSFFWYNPEDWNPTGLSPDQTLEIYVGGTYRAAINYSINREGTFFGYSVGNDPTSLQQYVGVFTNGAVYF
jgi:hypothetical protein